MAESTNCSPLGDGLVARRTRGGNYQEVMCPPPVAAYQNSWVVLTGACNVEPKIPMEVLL